MNIVVALFISSLAGATSDRGSHERQHSGTQHRHQRSDSLLSHHDIQMEVAAVQPFVWTAFSGIFSFRPNLLFANSLLDTGRLPRSGPVPASWPASVSRCDTFACQLE